MTANQIILEKFKEWTAKLEPKEARIKIFEEIRDIPYYLVPQIDDPYEWAASILEAKKASCSAKHYLMGLLFAKTGIAVKYATYPFKWDKQPIKYPPDLKELAMRSPVAYHLACKAHINNKWVLVDATWDMPLRGVGFSVNAHWDGVSDTLNAAIPFDEIIHETLEGRVDFVKNKKSLYTEEEKAAYAQFFAKFNAWLESLRRQYASRRAEG